MYQRFAAICTLAVLFVGVACHGGSTAPTLTPAQKLEIRQAQVTLLLAQQRLQQSKEYQDMTQAQADMNNTLKKAMDQLGINPADYQLDSDLNLKSLKPAPTPAPTKK